MVLWLLVTSVIPFSSSLIGVHSEQPQSYVVYAINIIAIQLAVIPRNLYLRRHPRLFNGAKAPSHPTGWRRALAVSLAAAGSIALAYYWITDYAPLAYLAIAPIAAIIQRIGNWRAEPSS